jgi:hypothetical protein
MNLFSMRHCQSYGTQVRPRGATNLHVNNSVHILFAKKLCRICNTSKKHMIFRRKRVMERGVVSPDPTQGPRNPNPSHFPLFPYSRRHQRCPSARLGDTGEGGAGISPLRFVWRVSERRCGGPEWCVERRPCSGKQSW